MPHIKFNWIDILFVTLLFRIGYVALKDGILLEFFRVLGLLIAFILSFNNYTLIGDFLSNHTKWTGTGPGIASFLLIFLSVLFIVKIFSRIANLFLAGGNISITNRLIGFILGLGRWLLSISLIYILAINTPFEYLSKSVRARSFSGKYIANIAPGVYKICIDFYPWSKVETPLVKLLELEG